MTSSLYYPDSPWLAEVHKSPLLLRGQCLLEEGIGGGGGNLSLKAQVFIRGKNCRAL